MTTPPEEQTAPESPAARPQGWCPACAARVALVLLPPIVQSVDGITLAFLLMGCPQCNMIVFPAGCLPLGLAPAARGQIAVPSTGGNLPPLNRAARRARGV